VEASLSNMQTTSKQFYHQTSVYLSPQPSNSHSTSQPLPHPPASRIYSSKYTDPKHGSSNSLSSGFASTPHSQPSPPDLAQAYRSAQFDLARYTHHSTLLYAIPPSSIACLDLLVGLYGWVDGVLGETSYKSDQASIMVRPSVASMRSIAKQGADIRVPTTNTVTLKSALSTSLEKLSRIRGGLLCAWAQRHAQTTLLEEKTTRRQHELESNTNAAESMTPGLRSTTMTPISSSGIEHRKPQNNVHKIHRSVGGRLRDLLSSSSSSTSLAGLSGEKGPRDSLDESPRGGQPSGTQDASAYGKFSLEEPVPEEGAETEIESDKGQSGQDTPDVPFPSSISTAAPSRPILPSRHSIQSPRGQGYISPLLASGTYPLSFESSPDLRLTLSGQVKAGTVISALGGVGGLTGMGDEDERREEVGRKKEGVLWGAGTWEGVSKGGGKGKWESELLQIPLKLC
jgi:hypothetical protein